jgi:hypothetical protein
VDRQKYKDLGPINVRRLVVSVSGGTQPDKIAQLMKDPDDGLLSRIQWGWPEPVEFGVSSKASDCVWAIDALDRLRQLELLQPQPGIPEAAPILVPLSEDAVLRLVEFAKEMESLKRDAGGLMISAYGKARGTVLRLSLVLEHLWWAGSSGFTAPPTTVSEKAVMAAAAMVGDYFIPMAERVYGDAASTQLDRNLVTLSKWIVKTRATEVYVRHMQRVVRLPGLGDAPAIHSAAKALVQAEWLRSPRANAFHQRARGAYTVNPVVLDTCG